MIRLVRLLAVLLLAGCASTSDTVTSSGWAITYSSGVTLQDSGNGCSFNFPAEPGHVNYLLKPFSIPKGAKSVSITFKITGTGKFSAVNKDCKLPPGFRIMLEVVGDTMIDEFGRWWSNPDSYTLVTDGKTHTLTVSLTPAHWSSVYGKPATQTLKEFNSALTRIGKAGPTYGSGCDFGHGASGDAKFELVSFSVK